MPSRAYERELHATKSALDMAREEIDRLRQRNDEIERQHQALKSAPPPAPPVHVRHAPDVVPVQFAPPPPPPPPPPMMPVGFGESMAERADARDYICS